MRRSAILTPFLALLLATAVQAEMVSVDGSDKTFPSTATSDFGGSQVGMKLTGTALREKAWFNVYVIGSYIANDASAHNATELASADVPKMLHLKMERGVGGKKMYNGMEEAILLNYSKADFKAELGQFEAYFKANDLEENDEVVFKHLPGQGLSCKVGSAAPIIVPNQKFARAVWDIYLGPKNIGDNFKTGLVSRLN